MNHEHQRLRLILLSAVLLVYGAAFIYGQFHPSTRWTLDSYEYASAATNLYESGTFYSGSLAGRRDPALYSRRTPLYPLILWLPLKLASDGALVVLLQVGLSLVAAWLLGDILRYLGVKAWLRWVCMAGFLLYPAQVIYSQTVMAEILLQFLFLLALYGLIRHLEFGGWRYALLMNLALALAPLAKPIAMFFWIPNLIFWGWLSFRRRPRSLVLLALLPLLSVSLWSYRNQLRTGHYHFSSIVSRYVRYMTPRSERSYDKTRSFAEADDGDWRSFWTSRLERWPATLWLYARGSAVFFVDPGRFDVYQFFGMEQDVSGLQIIRSSTADRWALLMRIRRSVLLYMILIAGLNVLIAAGFASSLFLGKIPREVKVFLILIVAYVTAAVGLVGFSRYRLAIEPYLLLGTVVTVSYLMERFRPRAGNR